MVGAKLKLSYFKHIMKKQGSLEKTLMLGKIEGNRARSNMRWTDFLKEAIELSLQELSMAVEDKTLCMSLFIQSVPRSHIQLNSM